MNKADVFKNIIFKYKLDRSIPLEVQREMDSARKQTLIQILKINKQYSILLLIAVSFFFWIKRFGMTYSLIKSAIIISSLGVVTTGLILGGAFVSVKKYIIDAPVKEKGVPALDEKIKGKESIKIIPEKTKIIENKDRAPAPYKIDVVSFEYDTNSKEIAGIMTKKIIYYLNKLKGFNTAGKIRASKKNIKAKRFLVGSITKIDLNFHISIKVVDSNNSILLLQLSEYFTEKSEIDSLCLRLSNRIIEKI